MNAKWRSYPPYYQHLGPILDRLESGECIVRLLPTPELSNSKGDLHGGVIASLLDIALSQAVRSAYEQAINVSTVSMTVNYLAIGGGEIKGRGKVLRAGRTIAYAEGEVSGRTGALIARASACFRVID